MKYYGFVTQKALPEADLPHERYNCGFTKTSERLQARQPDRRPLAGFEMNRVTGFMPDNGSYPRTMTVTPETLAQ
jgi:hypothetical protein